MKEWVLYVMTWASQLSGYPFPDRLPEVQWKSESWFSHRVCKDHIPCAVPSESVVEHVHPTKPRAR